MIKSVTIKDKTGKLIFKVICRKNGNYEIIKDPLLVEEHIEIDVRNEKNQKIIFGGW